MRRHASVGLFLFASLMQSFFYWSLSAVISKTKGIEALGELSFFMSLITPFAILGSLHLKNYYLTKNDKDIWEEILFLRLTFSNAVFLIFLVAILIAKPSLWMLSVSLTALKASESWSELCQMRWQRRSELLKTGVSLAGRYLVSIIICAYFLLYDSDFAIYGVLAVVGIVFAILDTLVEPIHLRNAKRSLPTFKIVIKLSFSALLTALLINLPRYLIKSYNGDASLGIFTALFYFYVIPTMLINISLQGFVHKINLFLEKGLIKIGFILIAICTLLFFSSLQLYGPMIMLKLYSIRMPWTLFHTVLLSALFLFGSLTTLMQFSLYGLNIYHVQLRASLLAFLIAALTGFWLVPNYGILGAFSSFLSGLLIQFCLYTYSYMAKKLG
jgi:hypothetical protein